ncbi:MAG: hypothetical protein ABSD68_00735 [Candidatus Micrarchaeales archaeon]|jgi:adenylate cyclase class 2
MGKESEIAILNINKKEVVKRLHELRAKHTGKHRFRRIEFVLRGDIKGDHSWGRIRTDGKKTTMTVKETHGKGGFTSMSEHEVNVDDFEETVRIMKRLVNSKIFFYFENTRDAYLLRKSQITIDKWPKIPTFVEIEASSMKEVKDIYKLLKIRGRLVGNLPMHKIYGFYGLKFREVMEKNEPKLKKILNNSPK